MASSSLASSSRTLAMPRSVFVRPSNLWLSHPLQSLQILSYLARSSGGKVLRFRTPRELEQQRMLNYSSITFETPELAAAACKDSLKLRVPFDSRMASDHTSLLTRSVLEDRGVGLKEIAPLVDLDLDIAKGLEPPLLLQEAEVTSANQSNGDGHRAVFASVREPVQKDVFEVELKLERRTEPDVPFKAAHIPNIRPDRRKAEHYTQLQAAVERFKGFGGNLSASSFSGPSSDTREPRRRTRFSQSESEQSTQPESEQSTQHEDKW